MSVGDPHCSSCDALCCRLTVVLCDQDRIAPHLTAREGNLLVMAQNEEGWCAAVDMGRMRCSIYHARPEICRRFAMAGPYCRAISAEAAAPSASSIPLMLC
ncbi:YkgJ family cysteine cluster protein [Pseudoxanthomonas composti]|uniref:YkgJ family cysteine cluster protein n=1 Tax=Pseudoxanthomonas composti TaxID=2137479 RepID=A0A4Q1JVJ8_9GAMM|nr:YkgJ family cysteine cluster protein [Pseudoxanthomonas composti]RXR05905.1 YkgJ family cysteine cluster protein [Pseudoxanthomonas composti]